MKNIIIEAPAKINLTLDVKGRRADDYHELVTVMHQVSLLDRIRLEKANEITISSTSTSIPTDENNLAFQAAYLLQQHLGKKEGVKIFIEKHIPVGAGLAGGSADAAAVLLGMNKLYGYDLDYESLWEIAFKLGSDVPFCLGNVSAIAKGRGEQLTPLPAIKELSFLLVKPDFQISTREVFAEFSLDKVKTSPDIDAFLKAWHEYDIIKLANNMANVLETVCIPKYPEIMKIKDEMKWHGALAAIMSGSGPTVLGLFQDQKMLQSAYEGFTKDYKEVFKISSYVRSE
ncbi:MAG TPA: 4-(cytidine 5'-diphospho)-2-C-methyl-D-erythritol kinase [Syntrophomonadaceae bacterium]|nr:4-(cytidine 5'-diphospho)-2-C-methyl-D-erythritol kinase [Syntrophomonadaceae bacterium]